MTLQERKETYEEMLEDFLADKEYMKTSGFCLWLFNKYKTGARADIENYPELIVQRPKALVYQVYWWDITSNGNGRNRRIAALKKAIKLINKLICIQKTT